MNKADNEASTRAVDSLLNYEVKCFVSFLDVFLRTTIPYPRLFFLVCDLFSPNVLYFQTVKYFNNEAYEVQKYDELLKSKFLCFYNFIHYY